jgi:hypothetical protein
MLDKGAYRDGGNDPRQRSFHKMMAALLRKSRKDYRGGNRIAVIAVDFLQRYFTYEKTENP